MNNKYYKEMSTIETEQAILECAERFAKKHVMRQMAYGDKNGNQSESAINVLWAMYKGERKVQDVEDLVSIFGCFIGLWSNRDWLQWFDLKTTNEYGNVRWIENMYTLVPGIENDEQYQAEKAEMWKMANKVFNRHSVQVLVEKKTENSEEEKKKLEKARQNVIIESFADYHDRPIELQEYDESEMKLTINSIIADLMSTVEKMPEYSKRDIAYRGYSRERYAKVVEKKENKILNRNHLKAEILKCIFDESLVQGNDVKEMVRTKTNKQKKLHTLICKKLKISVYEYNCLIDELKPLILEKMPWMAEVKKDRKLKMRKVAKYGDRSNYGINHLYDVQIGNCLLDCKPKRIKFIADMKQDILNWDKQQMYERLFLYDNDKKTYNAIYVTKPCELGFKIKKTKINFSSSYETEKTKKTFGRIIKVAKNNSATDNYYKHTITMKMHNAF